MICQIVPFPKLLSLRLLKSAGQVEGVLSRLLCFLLLVRSFDRQREAINARMVSIEARYRKQFTALDVMMSNMSQTSSYLTTQLANLNKISSSK